MIFIEDADGQLVNLAHVTRIRLTEKSDGTWAVLADVRHPGDSLACLRRGLATKDAARTWMHMNIPGVLVIL